VGRAADPAGRRLTGPPAGGLAGWPTMPSDGGPEDAASWPPPPEPVEVERVLVVGAHPDDIDFGCAGTAASWVAEGLDVRYLLLTRGEEGGFDDTPRVQVPVLREAEQRAAAAAVGVHDVTFLDGYRDGALVATPELVRDVSRVIRQVRPQRVVCQSPERDYARLPASHPDHMAAGEACVRAVYPAARNPFAFPELLQDEGLEPWTVRQLWLMAHPRSDTAVDVTDHMDAKLAALRAHASQTAHRFDDVAVMVRQWGRASAVAGRLPAGRLAEQFAVSHLR
jgi:LmbE family N-acetylglucosaminyl deacetylase